MLHTKCGNPNCVLCYMADNITGSPKRNDRRRRSAPGMGTANAIRAARAAAPDDDDGSDLDDEKRRYVRKPTAVTMTRRNRSRDEDGDDVGTEQKSGDTFTFTRIMASLFASPSQSTRNRSRVSTPDRVREANSVSQAPDVGHQPPRRTAQAGAAANTTATRQSAGSSPWVRPAPTVRGLPPRVVPNPARNIRPTATAVPPPGTVRPPPVTTDTTATATPHPADGLPSTNSGTALPTPRNEVDIVIHNLHADARGTSRAVRTQPMAVLLAHMMGIIAREGLLLHSVAATVHSITIVLEDGTLGKKRKGGFRDFVGELVNMAGAGSGGGIEHNEHVMAH